jgi:uncharacterized protein YjbI with pentapeptide repeats
LATSEGCQYKNETYNFTCDEPAIDTDSKLCIFHDINYLKGDNYDKHKEEVANRFNRKISKYSSNNIPFKFFGYCLPEISFKSYQFPDSLYFHDATFYGKADFRGAKFSEYTGFGRTTFYGKADFSGATFSNEGRFTERITWFGDTVFLDEANFDMSFSFITFFNYAKFSKRAYFGNAEFSGAFVTFTRAEFSGEADFSGAKIKEGSFSSVKFFNTKDFGNISVLINDNKKIPLT